MVRTALHARRRSARRGCAATCDAASAAQRPSPSLEPTKGNNATGTVSFTQRGDKVRRHRAMSRA